VGDRGVAESVVQTGIVST